MKALLCTYRVKKATLVDITSAIHDTPYTARNVMQQLERRGLAEHTHSFGVLLVPEQHVTRYNVFKLTRKGKRLAERIERGA